MIVIEQFIMATRAQEIARCREEMLGMAHGMPESAYELTPRDMVESPRPKIEKHDQERPVEGEMSSEKKDVEE
ncbi:hypothetical protein B296_00008498 [Ensete ventricosum]|uniref:Uncharacterized protein n=1 Tax=Ensete ventricosum TaxID=4639 RepID=A0A426Z292_ENSVE|nr:hypothetical protein B296_00008498 [Ensete ventricosum]